MKKYLCKISLVFALGIFMLPKPAHAMFPSMDIFGIPETVISNINLVNQFTKIKEGIKTVSKISNSIGSAVKSMSQFVNDKLDKARDIKEKVEAEVDRIKQVKEEINKRKEDFERVKAEVTDSIEYAKEYKEKVFGSDGLKDAVNNIGSFDKNEFSGAGGSPGDAASGVKNSSGTIRDTYSKPKDGDTDTSTPTSTTTTPPSSTTEGTSGSGNVKGRRPFKSSSYSGSEEIMSAFLGIGEGSGSDSGSGSGDITDGTVNDRFIVSKELTIKCNLKKDDLTNSGVIRACLEEILIHMSDKDASISADGQKIFSTIIKEQTLGTVADAMGTVAEAAQYEEKVLEPLSDDIQKASNTRDDITSLSQTNKQSGINILELNATAASQLSFDGMRELQRFDAADIAPKQNEDNQI